LLEEFSILAVSHIFIAWASVKIADTFWNALYCDNCLYEEPESYNHHHCSDCYPVILQPVGAAKKSGEHKLGTGCLWFSKRAIQSQKKEAKKTSQSKKKQKEAEPTGLPEKESMGELKVETPEMTALVDLAALAN
jgi:hypothetical protein